MEKRNECTAAGAVKKASDARAMDDVIDGAVAVFARRIADVADKVGRLSGGSVK